MSAPTEADASLALVRTFMIEVQYLGNHAFIIKPGRCVNVVNGQRVPFGEYMVLAHTTDGGEAVLGLRAARPRTPGGKVNKQVFPRVPVNCVNPVPFWSLYPAARYGRMAPYLNGLAKDGCTPTAWAMLADAIEDGQESTRDTAFDAGYQNGLALAVPLALFAALIRAESNRAEAATAEDADAMRRYESLRLAGGYPDLPLPTVPAQFSAPRLTYAVNHANHYPSGAL